MVFAGEEAEQGLLFLTIGDGFGGSLEDMLWD